MDYASPAELIVDCQLPDTPGIHERYFGEIDEHPPRRIQALPQSILEGPPVSDVELPGELDEYSLLVQLCRFKFCRIAHYHTISVGADTQLTYSSASLH